MAKKLPLSCFLWQASGKFGLHPQSGEEGSEFLGVKSAIAADSGADVESPRANRVDGLANELRPQAAGEEDRAIDRLTDATADEPVMPSSSAAQLLDRKLLVAGVEQQCVDVRRDALGGGDRGL